MEYLKNNNNIRMKKLRYIIFLFIPVVTLWFCTSSSGVKDKKAISNAATKDLNQSNKNVAVLELFTSQGCSSCPPADRLLGTYASKENIIALSFHVDYWDRLGWKDPFSAKGYTKRQYNYASALNASVYTPQLVINGRTEMVGSNANKISETITKVLHEAPGAELSIKSVDDENGQVNISFDASGNLTNAVLNIALVEKQTTTEIKAGENNGVTLDNFNVVRNFKTITEVRNGSSTSVIDIPFRTDLKNLSLVLFLQEKNNSKILAADQKSL
jgi:hypothetical protein